MWRVSLAQWLTGKPLHGVLGLAVTLVLPFSQIVSGAVMALVVLAGGLPLAAVLGSVAAALVAIATVALGSEPLVAVANALVFWVPPALTGELLRRSRSLTLTLQVTAIVALVGTLLLHAIVGDPVAFWQRQIDDLSAAFAEMGLSEQAEVLVAQKAVLAPQMTVLVVSTLWSLTALVVALGYWLYQALPDRAGRFGRFSDLNFGRIIAATIAVAALLALVSGAAWLQNFALVGFAVFWVQGLALLHWLRADGPLPVAVLIVVYGLLPILNVLLVMALAALGYSDAWFDYRARARRRGSG